jgi:hypothetical protein
LEEVGGSVTESSLFAKDGPLPERQSRRQLFANAAIAASRVPTRCNSFVSAVIGCPPVQPTNYQSNCKEKGRQIGGLRLGRHVMKTRQVLLLLHSRRDDDPQLGGNGRATGLTWSSGGEKGSPANIVNYPEQEPRPGGRGEGAQAGFKAPQAFCQRGVRDAGR